MKRTLVAIILLCIPASSFAADPFKAVVKAIEHEYEVHHHGIPWYAHMIVKPAMWVSGVKGFKLAEFENCSFGDEEKQARVADVIERTAGLEWQRIVRVRSRADNETVYIYVKPDGQRFTMLVVSVESNEAVIVQMTLKLSRLEKLLSDNTDAIARSQTRHREPVRRGETAEAALLVTSDTPGGYGIIVP
jgi:hypothetical protein